MGLLLTHPGGTMGIAAPAALPQGAVSCRDVTKDFGTGESRVQALRGATLDAAAGEMTLLIGPSGCGKTTLISIIAGLLNPTQGDVTVLGQNLVGLRGRRLVDFRSKHIGFVFQQFNLLPALTAAENAAVPLMIAGVSRRQAVERASHLLDTLGMGARIRALPTQLSGGQQQRVAIARALVHEPRLLVCDEPTSALDAQSGHTTMELLRKVAIQRDRAVLVVTHDSRVFEFGDRLVRMEDGRVASVESRAAVEAPHGFDSSHGK